MEVPSPSVGLYVQFIDLCSKVKQPSPQNFSMKDTVEITILCFVLPPHQLIINELSKGLMHNAGLSKVSPCHAVGILAARHSPSELATRY